MDWTSLPTITTDRLALRLISDDDVDAIFEVFSDPEVMRYWSTTPLANREGAVALVNEIHDSFERQVMLKWGVARRADNLIIGTTTLYNLDFTNRRAELGYALARKHWGQGYMHEALQALLSYAFETLDLRRLKRTLIHETNLQLKVWSGWVFSEKVSCANVGKLAGRFRTRCFMVCSARSGRNSR